MMFQFAHQNLNVLDLDRSLAFYSAALSLKEVRRSEKPAFTIVFLGDEQTGFQLELTWMKERTQPYNLGDEEFHLALKTDDMEEAHRLHEKMGCICYENPAMGVYFIKDPDGYWIEIVPLNK